MFATIILPLAKPAIATFTLFYLVGNWNTYFSAVIYLNNDSKWPLQVFLGQMLIHNDEKTDYGSSSIRFFRSISIRGCS
ncbi:ABC-type glycerol-3-phosphate transport system permease component [Bacillus sp. 3255]|nr:ABC-type glycerol-3-phosphate transport system permease component [Bacillus sp. 3255]